MLQSPITIVPAVLTCAITSLAFGGKCAPDQLLQVGVTSNTGSQPRYLQVADFNDDGILDLAVASTSETSIALQYGDGIGGFGLPVTTSLGATAAGLASADLNDDGFTDLIVLLTWGEARILYGNGAGGFSFQESIQIPGTPFDLAVGDVDGDGDLDVSALYQQNASSARWVGVWLRGGTSWNGGPFRQAPESSTELALIDLDGDTFLDYAVNEPSANRVRIYSGGNGNQLLLPTIVPVLDMKVLDINFDGFDDIVFARDAGAGIMLGGEGGLFGIPFLALGFGTHASVDVGDLNGDGHLDLIAGSFGTTFSLWLGNGDGTVGSSGPFTAGNVALYVSIVDINDDCAPDVLVLDGQPLGHVTTLFNICVPECPSDTNGDGAVDFGDLIAVLAQWQCVGNCSADTDCSQDVGFGDLLKVLSDWGPCS